MDLGTTNLKATLFDENGNAVASSSSSSYKLIFPGPNMVEQDPNAWWTAARDVLREIVSAAGEKIASQICGIAVSSHIVSMLPVDREGGVLRNAIIWMDKRSAGDLDDILNTIGFPEYVSIVGAQPNVAFLPSKILWFKRHEPQLFSKTYRILQASSYINYKLTDQLTMDMDTASLCQCLDLQTLRWSEAISKAIGIDLNALLPQPVRNDEIIGFVTEEAARQTGLKRGIPVVAGTADAVASMYATGISALGQAGESSGTTSLVFVGHDKPTRTDIPIVAKPCTIAGIPYMFNAPINATGASLNWYLDNLGKAEYDYAEAHQIDAYDHLNALASKSPAGCNGLIYFPYLLGERAPLWNSYSRGMFIGLSLDTEPMHMIRAIFEGTAYALRHVIDTIRETGAAADCLRIAGGGAKSRTWSQIKASVLRMPVYRLDDKTGDVTFGDALIAGHATGVYPDLSDSIRKLISIKEVIDPVEDWSKTYDALYPFYLDMYRHLDDDLKRLDSVINPKR